MGLKKWSTEEIDLLKKEYLNHSNEELSQLFNRPKNGITSKLSKLGLTRPNKNQCNKDYFDKIDCQEKAYWVGFLFADGWVYYNKEGSSFEVGIELKISDKEHLNKFNNSIQGNYEITERKRTSDFGRESLVVGETCRIRVYSIKMCEDLINLGIIPQKTYNQTNLPNIPDEYFFDFLRGYIDGDGTYGIRKKSNYDYFYPVISLVCFNKSVLYLIQDELKKHDITAYVYDDKNCGKLMVRRKKEVVQLINLMYKNANIYLDRKYETIDHILKTFS
jgi:intein-encoded DNA endonuclease-like protein